MCNYKPPYPVPIFNYRSVEFPSLLKAEKGSEDVSRKKEENRKDTRQESCCQEEEEEEGKSRQRKIEKNDKNGLQEEAIANAGK
jgi:hypothetical protein